MAASPSHDRLNAQNSSPSAATGLGRESEHLKSGHLKDVPESFELRETLRRRTEELAATLDKSQPMARHEIERHSRRVLQELKLSERYLGWTMVALASAFWHDQVAAVPPERRLLLLPRCLRNASTCSAEYDQWGLLCRDCGACSLTDLRAEARRRGYNVLIAEGSPAVMQIILSGQIDALLGVACLDVLERTLDKILLAGIPCMAVPLLTNGCENTTVDEARIRQMVDTPHRPAEVRTRTYVHLMRAAAQMFEPERLERLIPRLRSGVDRVEGHGHAVEILDPIACTEAVAYDFLMAGGKHSRPFITLAVYDAVTGGRATSSHGATYAAQLPDSVRAIALAIETFHKASLVHDDIEDNDAVRYDQPTLHRRYGTATAINVGDYLIGLGYRIVAAQRDRLPGDVVADVLAVFAQAHTKLCEGQGAELVWRDARDKRLKPIDALKIYALKTAPAFEAALLVGMRLARSLEAYREAAGRFSRHLGVAYQIVNDLDDWQQTPDSRRPGGSDLLGGRPTVLWALALEGLNAADRTELETLVKQPQHDEATLARAEQLYTKADVFEKAAALVTKHHQRAKEAADTLDCEPLRRLMHFLADAILDRRSLSVSEM